MRVQVPSIPYAGVAQLVERRSSKPAVAGSIPATRTYGEALPTGLVANVAQRDGEAIGNAASSKIGSIPILLT
jgi:hypothetical protein